MARIAEVLRPSLVVGTANAGGLGILASATMTYDELELAIKKVKSRTDQPFGVNLRADATDAPERIALLVREGVKVASFALAPKPEQIARLKGARAVGIAGGPAKCAFVKDELRFDAAVDHRAKDFSPRLAAACPDGIDVYFENVGGTVWEAVLPLLNDFARVPVAGLIAQYNGVPQGDGVDRLPVTMRQILSKRLTVRGFIYYDFAAEHYSDFLREVGAGIASGRIRYREDIVDGLENAPEAFIGMLEGRNFGKLIVRVAA